MAGPAAPGPLHSLGSRAHSHTQTASALSGSIPAWLYVAQPHDQIECVRSSTETRRTASACSFTISSHAARGCSPSRPPVPGADWNCSSSATRPAGMPISVNLRTRPRMPVRMIRLARTGPSRCSCGTFGDVK
jgi:hypothetical protein